MPSIGRVVTLGGSDQRLDKMANPSVLDQLAAYGPQERPGAVVHALRQLSRRAGRDLVLIARLAHEAHAGGYWSQVKRKSGEPYLTEEEFFNDVMDMASWRTALRRVALGRAIEALPAGDHEGQREHIAEKLAELGVHRASVLAPVLERHATEPDAILGWLDRASGIPAEDLQKAVTQAMTTASPEPREPVDRVAGYLRSVMPSFEAREVLEEFLRLGRQVTEGGTTVGILLAACQECIGSWSHRGTR